MIEVAVVHHPGTMRFLTVRLENESGDNVLLSDTFGYIADKQLTFYLLTGECTINLTQAQNNNSIINEYISNTDGSVIKNISLSYSWCMKDNNGMKEGNYVIDYDGLYPNDTNYTKYKVTKWTESAPLLKVKVNGVLRQPDSVSFNQKGITIVK